jgi:hypothetical protein
MKDATCTSKNNMSSTKQGGARNRSTKAKDLKSEDCANNKADEKKPNTGCCSKNQQSCS